MLTACLSDVEWVPHFDLNPFDQFSSSHQTVIPTDVAQLFLASVTP